MGDLYSSAITLLQVLTGLGLVGIVVALALPGTVYAARSVLRTATAAQYFLASEAGEDPNIERFAGLYLNDYRMETWTGDPDDAIARVTRLRELQWATSQTVDRKLTQSTTPVAELAALIPGLLQDLPPVDFESNVTAASELLGLIAANETRDSGLPPPQGDRQVAQHLKRSPLSTPQLFELLVAAVVGLSYRRQGEANAVRSRGTPRNIAKTLDLIAEGESAHVEFKESLRTNVATGRPHPKLINGVLRSMLAFANTSGGTILVGVNDHGEIVGIDDEGASPDQLLGFLHGQLAAKVGTMSLRLFDARLERIGLATILRIECHASDNPVYFEEGGTQTVYVRQGARTVADEKPTPPRT